MKRRLTFLLTAFLLLTGMTSWGQQRTEASIDFSQQGYENAQVIDTAVIDDNVSVYFFKGTNSNAPKYYTSGSAIRCYAGNFFTIETTSGSISSITITFGSSDGSNVITTDIDTFTSPTWIGNSSSVTFTIGGTSGNRRIQGLAVTYSSGSQQETVATPTFNPAGGTYTEPQQVTISCATEGATICYTIDGTEPNENSAQFTAGVPLNISETTTVKAKAYKSGHNPSSTATATYNFPSAINISGITAPGTYIVQGTIVAKSSRGFIVGDGTGYIYYYNQNYAQSDYNIGDIVRLSGSVVTYGGVFEFNNTTTITTATTSNYVEEEPTVITGAEMDNRVASTTPAQLSTYVQYIGTLTVSGSYYNITNIEGATTAKGSISFPLNTEFAALNGQVVVVKGYFVGISSSQYYNTMLGSIEASEVPEPELTITPTELSGFQYVYGEGPSAPQSIVVSGANLTSDVAFSAPDGFEFTLDTTTYYLGLTLGTIEGTLNPTTIYVRMKSGLEVGDHSGEISVLSGSLTPTIALSGMVLEANTPVLSATPASLSGFTYDYDEGGPSEISYFDLAGNYLTGPAQVLPSESFEVSTLGGDLFHAENPANVFSPGDFYDIKVYVRMKAGLEVGTYEEQLVAVSEGADTLYINVSGIVTGTTPTPPDPPAPGDGNYVRISELSSLADGAYVVFAARFNENATDYYAMSNASSGKPSGVLFTSATADENEVLPASIVDEESSYYWIVGVTANGYTFTNAAGELIGYSSSTNFTTGGDNTEWSIEFGTAGDAAMVPNYPGFLITNVNNDVRHFALNSNHNFGPYHSNNFNNSGYNFYLDIFVKTEGGVPPTPTVATPTFTPAAGTYYEAQTVNITCATEGATIHYSTVSANGPWTTYESALTVAESMTIWAYAEKEGYNDSNIAEAAYTIQSGSGSVVIFNQDWEGEMNGWTFVDVTGEMTWSVASYQSNHYAYANGYNHGANEDWCISPAFNLDAYDNPTLSFRTATKFDGNVLQVFFSNDYNGTNTATATWTALECELSTGNYTWVESGDIDLSGFSGSNCYIGFKYTCEESQAAAWEVDDILLVGQTSDPVVTVTPLTLTGFSYIEGNGPSDEQSFTVSGLNLSANVVIEDATDYEISLGSGTNFVAQSTLTLSHNNGTIEETTIYVRLKAGLAVGNYNDEDITITCDDVDDVEVTCNGSVTAEPVPGDDYVRISDAGQLVAGNRVILAVRYNDTEDAYLAASNTLTSGKLTTTEFTSAMNGTDEIIPSSILADEDSFYWTVDVTDDGYTFTNANGDMIGYGNSGTNLVLNGEKTVWTIEGGVSAPESLVPGYYGFNIVNATTDTRAMALRVTESESVVKAYATSNMTDGQYNFFLDIFMQGEGGVPPTPTVATPVFTPAAGTYYETQDVTISCATSDATIYYSLDSETGPWSEYEEAITVDENMIIWAYAVKTGYNDSPFVSAEYVIMNDINIIFNQDWEEDWHGWTQVNVEGEDAEWTIAEHSGNHYAYMNGYNHGANEDWLISPAFDLDSYSDVVLTFLTAMNYNGPDIEVYFSNDYDGTDPNTASWSPLTCELSPGSWAWTESGEISLDGFNGSNCYIAFKYTCTESEAAAWEVDDIMLISGGGSTNPTLTATPNTINGLDYIEGEGPSSSQSYTLTGSNLVGEGDVTLTASENFEISLDDEDYFTTLYVQYADGQLVDQPVTIYVRLVEGLEMGTYPGTINHEGGEATTEVVLNGTVHSEDEPMMLAMMPYYIQGNNGSNNNRVPVAVATYFFNLEPETTYRYTNQFVDSNDGPETAGAGNVIYADIEGFYRSTSPSLSTEGGYGEFTTDEDGFGFVWFINEPTANARFTPGNHVYLRARLNDGHDGTTVEQIFTSDEYATVLNFGNEIDEYSGSAFYAKSNEAAKSFALLLADDEGGRPIYSTSIETVGVDYVNINQYADFYKDLVAGKDGWFGGILPNDNKDGVNTIWIVDIDSYVVNEFNVVNGLWNPNANTINPTNGLDEPIFIDLTDDGVDEAVIANVKVWNTDHEFVIENGDDIHYTMTVYNVLGQPMMQHQINAGSIERISHSLATGVYVISLQNNQSNVSVKVIVR